MGVVSAREGGGGLDWVGSCSTRSLGEEVGWG